MYPYQVDVMCLDDYDDGWLECVAGERFRVLWVTFRALRWMRPDAWWLLSEKDAARDDGESLVAVEAL